MTKVMDSYDAGKDKPLVEALKEVKAEFLIVGFYSDWLYPPERGKEIQIAAMTVSYTHLTLPTTPYV